MLWRSLQATSSSDKTFLHLSRCRVWNELPILQLDFQLLFPSSKMVQAERHRAEEMIACERQAKEARMQPGLTTFENILAARCTLKSTSAAEAVDPVEVALQDMAERMERLQQDSDRRCRAMQEAVDRAKAPPIELVHKPFPCL